MNSTVKLCCCIGAASVEAIASMATMAIKCPHMQFTVVDTSAPLINAWSNYDHQNNLLPQNALSEPALFELIDTASKLPNYLTFSTNVQKHVAEADIIFVSAQVPTKTRGVGAGKAMDATQLEATARIIAEVSTSDKIIVEKSSVPLKSADYIQRILKFCCKDKGLQFHILSNPDFTTEGTVVHDLMNPDRVLIGTNTAEAHHAQQILIHDIYSHWVPRNRILTTNLWSVELSKLTASAMAAQRISSMNAISSLCEAVGAHVSDVANAVGMDSRIGHGFLQDSGLSFSSSSSTFKKDILGLVYICESYGLSEVATYWNQVLLMDEYQKSRFVKRTISSMFGSLAKKKIAVLGFATRNGSSDTTESPAIQVCHGLLEDQASLSIYDPRVPAQQISSDLREAAVADYRSYHEAVSIPNASVACDPYEAANGAHGVCILTAWEEFKQLNFQRIYDSMEKPAFIFDGQNVVKDAGKLRRIGFVVYSIGKPLDPFVKALPNQPRC